MMDDKVRQQIKDKFLANFDKYEDVIVIGAKKNGALTIADTFYPSDRLSVMGAYIYWIHENHGEEIKSFLDAITMATLCAALKYRVGDMPIGNKEGVNNGRK